jgi:NAD(P) transhydrogenase subunit alpha
MKIAVAKGIDPSEPRVAAPPDAVKKFKAIGADVVIEPGPASSPACPIPNSPCPAPPSARMR